MAGWVTAVADELEAAAATDAPAPRRSLLAGGRVPSIPEGCDRGEWEARRRRAAFDPDEFLPGSLAAPRMGA